MILLPTLNRVDLLKRFLSSVEQTAAVPGKILVDNKDYDENKAGYDSIACPKGWSLLLTGDAVSMGDKVRTAWKFVKDEKYIGLLNDDHVCVTKDWDKKVEALLDGTNMVSTNDGGWNFGHRVVGLTAWSTPLLDVVGFPIFPRNLQHLYVDDIWKAIGESAGCWLETLTIDIHHKHTFKREMGEDETFKKVYAPSSWEYDAKEFKHFMEQDFKNVVQKVIALREGQILKDKHV